MPIQPWYRRPEEPAAARTAFAGCGFSKHTTDVLASNDLGTLAKLLAQPPEELRYLHGIGKKGRAEVRLGWRERAMGIKSWPRYLANAWSDAFLTAAWVVDQHGLRYAPPI